MWSSLSPLRSTQLLALSNLSVTPSVAGTIFGALEYLTSFPYGCTEQTMSSFLPNVIVTQALKDLQLKSKIDPAALEKKVRAGLERLYDYQHEDGGWGWWKTDDSHPFMTAYVVAGLAQAKAAGLRCPATTFWKRAAPGCAPCSIRARIVAPDVRAYAVLRAWSRAAQKISALLDAAWSPALRNDRIRTRAARPGDAGRLRRAAPPKRPPRSNRRRCRTTSKRAGPSTATRCSISAGDATPEATAHALKLLTLLRPASPLLPKAALWLVNHRDQGYYWSSTKQTAMVVYGLTGYLKASGELHPEFRRHTRGERKANLIEPFQRSRRPRARRAGNPLKAADLAPGANKIRISKSGEGRLYWSARADYYSTEEKQAATGSQSLSLTRDYFKLIPVKEGGRIVYQLDPLDGPAQIGDVLVARLTISGGSWRYLLVEDPIPAGVEFIENDQYYRLKNQPPWWRYFYARREFHDDHAALFQTWFTGKEAQHLYLMKVVNPGKFRVSPARVQPMYQPQFLSTTDSKVLEVK